MIADDSSKHSKFKIPQIRLLQKYAPTMPMREANLKTVRQLMEESELLLKSNVSLITFVPVEETEFVKKNDSNTKNSMKLLNELPTSKQKKRSKLVNYTSSRKNAVLDLDKKALERLKNIQEPQLDMSSKHKMKSKSSKKREAKSQGEGEKSKENFDCIQNSGKSLHDLDKQNRSGEQNEHLTETDYYCIEWMSKNFEEKSKNTKKFKNKAL